MEDIILIILGILFVIFSILAQIEMGREYRKIPDMYKRAIDDIFFKKPK